MRQQQYEQALKDIRNVLWEANEYSTTCTGINEAMAIINTVLTGGGNVPRPDVTEHQRHASMRRDEANNNSGY